MKPNNTIEKKWGAVYVGAGGNMLEYKPKLYRLLLDTVPFGLRLQGSNWNHVPVLKDVWMGPLPTNEIPNAYGSALTVLASTIHTQEIYEMINNRIFEALSCGAIVVMSNFCPSIHREFGDLIMYINETHSFKRIIDYIQSDEAQANRIREAGRAEILKKHTWQHRVVELLDFYHQLPSSSNTSYEDLIRHSFYGERQGYINIKSCFRPNCRNVIVMVSTMLYNHSDVVFVVLPGIFRRLKRDYNVQFLSEIEVSVERIEYADLLIAVVTPFDSLDCFMKALVSPRMQKRAAYLIGFDASLLSEALATAAVLQLPVKYNHYDVLWFRDAFEIKLWREAGLSFTTIRMQHAFGVGKLEVTERSIVKNNGFFLFVCFWTFRHLCLLSERNSLLGTRNGSDSQVLLLGGEWTGWVEMAGVLEVDMLHNVVHVKDGSVGDAVRRVQSAEKVFIMHEEVATASTTVDVLWPFVAAAVAGVSIHFSRRNDHFLSLLDSDIMGNEDDKAIRRAVSMRDWDEEVYLQGMLREGVDKLQGLGSANSAVTVTEVELNDSISSQLSLLDADYLHILSRSKHILNLFRLEVHNFYVGRDGQCCISIKSSNDLDDSSSNHDSRVADSDSMCMLRPFRYLVLVAADTMDVQIADPMSHTCYNSSASNHCMKESSSSKYLKLSLRGNFYSDVTFSTCLSFQLENPSLPSMQWLS
eukprot:CAMPEP_0170056900 /NCGR_PEP_ID=MMETSP0019_2-20121128/120_1 /TAXON_ID=98059 /ORGANISM="Dinobryon sp., Strain UTEXLB2267" /LENGTH=698 /DNA_ID=CAMNT_0010261497 /DNA_START=351 /DNA_END=2443 /DNA_ORIENTATION=+